MQIVIDIPDMVYDKIRNKTEGKGIIECNSKNMADSIYNGTQLPKGHGRLVDVKEILDSYENSYKGTHADDLAAFLSDYVQTVVPADKEDAE